jgi:ribonuclease G
MTRQNVTDGPREILTRKCPTCAGDGIVYSDESVAIDIERKLRELAAKPRSKAFTIELNARIAAMVVPRLEELEALTKRRFLILGRPNVHNDHFAVLKEGAYEQLAPEAPVQEGQKLEVQPVEVGLYDPSAGVAKLDGYAVVVAGAAKQVGKKLKVQVDRVFEGVAYASVVTTRKPVEPPITAETEAEKPTRATKSTTATTPAEPKKAEPKKAAAAKAVEAEAEEAEPAEAVAEAAEEEAATDTAAADAARKKRRRGTRGGRGRKRKPAGAAAAAAEAVEEEAEQPEPPTEAVEKAPRIHVPDLDLGAEDEVTEEGAEPSDNGSEAARKKRRRGTRGGRNRRKKPAAAVNGVEPAAGEAEAAEPEPAPVAAAAPEEQPGFEYVPMAEWIDDIEDRS